MISSRDATTRSRWSVWRGFPDPRKGGVLYAPFGPGVYELRRRSTGRLVLVGIGGKCAWRMSSLLPQPLGTGTRKNEAKREYVLENLGDIEYRTRRCATRNDARVIEKKMLNANAYVFGT